MVVAVVCIVVGCDNQDPVDKVVNATNQQSTPGQQSTPEVESSESVEETTIEQSEAVVSTEEQNSSIGAGETATDNKVLRHAVFFSFQEDSTPEDLSLIHI